MRREAGGCGTHPSVPSFTAKGEEPSRDRVRWQCPTDPLGCTRRQKAPLYVPQILPTALCTPSHVPTQGTGKAGGKTRTRDAPLQLEGEEKPSQGGETKSRRGSPARAQASCSPPLQPTSSQTPQPHSRPLPTPPGPGARRSPGFGCGAGTRRVTAGAGRPLVRAGRTAPGGPEPSRGGSRGAGSPPGDGPQVCRLGPGHPGLQPGGVLLGVLQGGASLLLGHQRAELAPGTFPKPPQGNVPSSHHLHGRRAAVEVPVEGQARELALQPQAEPTGSVLAGEGGGGVGLPGQQGGHEVGQAVQEGGDVGRQPLVQLLGKGKARRLAGPWRAEPWQTRRSGW